MQSDRYFQNQGTINMNRLTDLAAGLPRRAVIGGILIIALFAFEIFNFDTTRYALNNLLGNVSFLNLKWAGILALAFCAIDFAGLVRLFTPEKGADEPKEVWYLMGAWLLGATMNAVMTWWAVSLTLLNHEFGNEVLSREELLTYVPIFVAVLVWLTRILFIGAFTVAGEHIFEISYEQPRKRNQPTNPINRPAQKPTRKPYREPARKVAPRPAAVFTEDVPEFMEDYPTTVNPAPKRENSRIRQRPPMPRNGVRKVPYTSKIQARGRRQ